MDRDARDFDEQLQMLGSQLQLLSFRMTYLGKQALSRQNSTGFGCLQRALRELYFNYLSIGSKVVDKSSERTLIFQESGVSFRYWDSYARQFQQDFYPFESVTYVDLVHFHTFRGKKRRFGYFRRHSDPRDVIPESVLILLHRREHRLLRRMTHSPILCLVTRRPHGIQFHECHLHLVDTESVGLAFVQEFDVRSRARRETTSSQQQQLVHQQSGQLLSRYSPWYDRGGGGGGSRWTSQPMLFQQQTLASDLSEPDLTPMSTGSGSSRQQHRKEALVQRYRELQLMNVASEYEDGTGDPQTPAVPPPLPPRRRLPPAGGVRVLPWGPPPQRPTVIAADAAGGYGNARHRDQFAVGGPSRLGIGRREPPQQPQAALAGSHPDGIRFGANAGAVDFGAALGYLP